MLLKEFCLKNSLGNLGASLFDPFPSPTTLPIFSRGNTRRLIFTAHVYHLNRLCYGQNEVCQGYRVFVVCSHLVTMMVCIPMDKVALGVWACLHHLHMIAEITFKFIILDNIKWNPFSTYNPIFSLNNFFSQYVHITSKTQRLLENANFLSQIVFLSVIVLRRPCNLALLLLLSFLIF